MDFKDVKLLTYEHQNVFWGDNGFRYGAKAVVSIKGYILDLANTFGVKDVFQACKSLSESLQQNQDIVINGVNYGFGRITSVSFDSGNWVKATEYNASIEITKEGYLEDFSSRKEFSNSVISSIDPNIEYIENFSENYSVDYSSNEDSISGVHSIDLKVSDLFTGDRISFAKNFASLLFSKTFSQNMSEVSFYSKPPDNLRKDYYSEIYDAINGSCSFKRSFSYSNTDECFSVSRSISMSIGENGYTNVTESALVKGECLEPTLFDSAVSGFEYEVLGCYGRCVDVFNKYKTSFSIQQNLINEEIDRSVSKNRFTSEIEYSITFTNDPRVNGNYIYEYTLDLSRSEDFIWNASESGSVKGKGVLGSDEKFDNAFAGWNSKKGGITARVESFYADHASIKPPSYSLKLINKTVTHKPFEGEVSYSWSFTDDTTLNMASEIRRTSIEITDAKATRIHNDFLIPGGAAAYAIAQAANQSAQGERTVSANLEIASSVNPFVGESFLNNCVSIADANKGLGTDLYLDSFSFSSDEIEQNVNFNATYKYSEAANAN